MKDENPLQKPKHVENEEKILDFWEKNNIFKKSLQKPSPKGEYVFYDGPPFATGEPHYGHVVPGTVKDIIPRYKTMKGYHVRRRWGWDCHGLPVENLVEKELKLLSKKDIVDYGIGKFNAVAQNSVMRYADDWRRIIPRLGRWVDMEDDYRTMDASYTESVWWAFSELHKKGLIYEGFKSMNLCPRCETTLSNFEVSQGYKDITDISVYVKFKLVGEENTFVLAWTTTPWTLPGNVALAVNTDIKYVKVEVGGALLILAKSRLETIKTEYKVVAEMDGKDLVGKSYEPIFNYYSSDKKLKNVDNGWKIYGASFVTVDTGTGIVHIAPAFGADDYELSQKYSLPFVQHVGTNGKFKKEVTNFAGQDVKPKDTAEEKDNHQKADVEMIKYLAKSERLFAKEKIIHSYPHCWRCDTPLLNYASSSWFVKVTDLKDKLVKENTRVKWTPKEVGEGRFGNWLLGARDWAISRSRFWGAPLPVWRDEKTEECHVLGSVEEMRKYSKASNTYYVCRHGEAENNTKNVISSKASNQHHLTSTGKIQAQNAGKWLLDKKIDLVFVSPFLRTKETADIISRVIGVNNVTVDERLSEVNTGIWDGKDFNEYVKNFAHANRFTQTPEGGENFVDIKKRMGDFIYDMENKYKGKNILIVSHDTPIFLLTAIAKGLNRKESIALRGTNDHFNANAKPVKLEFNPLPHNAEYELDLHRPFIDEIQLTKENGNKLKRIPEVFDCWFESGSMPFGESHYPFNKCDFNPKPGPFSKILGRTKGYPADFIAEGLDQTRGWFYSMIVLGVALFGKSPYKNVIVNGLVLAEDGQKMSKSKKNYPDLMLVVNKYGSDALRYVLMSSPVVRAQDFLFSEKAVDEVVKKHIGRLNNVVSFYEMYATDNIPEVKSTHPLDIWITTRLKEVTKEISDGLEKYEIDRAARPLADFIDDLSTWYIRRSRDRYKSDDVNDKNMALKTTRNVLLDFAKVLAPFMPFLAEDIYKRLNGPLESVHLESWPTLTKFDHKVLTNMSEVRRISSLALEARSKAKINVRQPLSKLTIKQNLSKELLDTISDEVNVKTVEIDTKVNDEVYLDTTLTPELKDEGVIRELIRSVQELRKQKGLTIKDRVVLVIDTDNVLAELVKKNMGVIVSTTLLNDVKFSHLETEAITVGEYSAKMDIEK
jgi:isoleucyl-tRNA synthetase